MSNHKIPPPMSVRLRCDGEEFDAVRVRDGVYEIAEVVLSGVVAHGDLVRANSNGRVTSFFAKRFQTEVAFLRNLDEAIESVERKRRQGYAARVVCRAALYAAPLDEATVVPWASAEDDDAEMERAWGRWEAQYGSPLQFHDDVPYYVGTRYERGWKHLFAHYTQPGTTVDGYSAYPASKSWRPNGRTMGMRLTKAEFARMVALRVQTERDGVEYEYLESIDALRMMMWARSAYGEEWAEAPLASIDASYWPTEIVREMLEATAHLEPEQTTYPRPLSLSQMAFW